MLTPHHRIHRQFGISGPPPQNLPNPGVFLVFETELPIRLGGVGGRRGILDRIDVLGHGKSCPFDWLSAGSPAQTLPESTDPRWGPIGVSLPEAPGQWFKGHQSKSSTSTLLYLRRKRGYTDVMSYDLVARSAMDRLNLLVESLRIVIVTGPRQAGKTTLLTMLRDRLGGSWRSLDNDQALAAALADPREFARFGERPIIIDEVQRGGDPLILAIKNVVDEDDSPGHFVLSGSTRFLAIPTLSESLAGRAVFVELWPLSVAERVGRPVDLVSLFGDPQELLRRAVDSPWSREDYVRLLVEGGFPEVLRLPEAVRGAWFDGYLHTVIQRDVRQFADIRHGAVLPQLLRLVAARGGSPVIATDLARTVQMNQATTRDYLSYLNMVYLTIQLPAWSSSLSTKAAKAPKTFLADVGIAAHLLGMDIASLREPGNQALGVLLETFVVTEVIKLLAYHDRAPGVFYFRDRDGREIDIVIEGRDGRIIAVEVKASASATTKDFRHLAWLRDKLGDKFVAGVVCNLGAETLSFGDRLLAVPVSALWHHFRLTDLS